MTKFIELTDELISGDLILDKQHDDLVGCMNSLYKKLDEYYIQYNPEQTIDKRKPRYSQFESARKLSKGILTKEFEILDEYVTKHFEHEEKFAEEYNYPDLKVLKTSHKILKGLYKLTQESFEFYINERSIVTKGHIDSMILLIIEMFESHVVEIDFKLIKFLQEQPRFNHNNK